MCVWLKLKLAPKGDFCVVSVGAFFCKFLSAQYQAIPERANTVNFHPKHPKWDQNLQFTPQSETTSISVTFIWEPPPRGGLKGLFILEFVHILTAFIILSLCSHYNASSIAAPLLSLTEQWRKELDKLKITGQVSMDFWSDCSQTAKIWSWWENN